MCLITTENAIYSICTATTEIPLWITPFCCHYGTCALKLLCCRYWCSIVVYIYQSCDPILFSICCGMINLDPIACCNKQVFFVDPSFLHYWKSVLVQLSLMNLYYHSRNATINLFAIWKTKTGPYWPCFLSQVCPNNSWTCALEHYIATWFCTHEESSDLVQKHMDHLCLEWIQSACIWFLLIPCCSQNN